MNECIGTHSYQVQLQSTNVSLDSELRLIKVTFMQKMIKLKTWLRQEITRLGQRKVVNRKGMCGKWS